MGTRKRSLLRILTMTILLGIIVTPLSLSASPTGWSLIWSDDFTGEDGSAIDSSKWGFDIGGNGWGNAELQYYTNRTANVYIQNNMCVIKAMKENYGGNQYTSGRILTARKFDFTYGKVEAAVKLPYGQGIWPAFWMLGANVNSGAPWPICGEIDIMEHMGREPSTIYGVIHGPGYSGGKRLEASYSISGKFNDGFHKFAVEWEPNVIRWYCDGNLYQTRTSADLGGKPWVFDHDFFIIFNLAVGGQWPGFPDPTTIFPQYLTIDYIRVYQKGTETPAGTTGPALAQQAALIPGLVEAENFTAMSGIQVEKCSEGGRNVAWVDTGDWMEYKVNVQSSGTYKVEYRVASPNAIGKIDFRSGNDVVRTVSVPDTGGWQAWTTASVHINLHAGLQMIQIYANSGGFNLNWLRFTLVNSK